MEPEPGHFTAALGLQAPWYAADVRLNEGPNLLETNVAFSRGGKSACGWRGAGNQPVHDTKCPTWEQKRLFEQKSFNHVAIPSIAGEFMGRTRQVKVPWNRVESGLTHAFETLAVTFIKDSGR